MTGPGIDRPERDAVIIGGCGRVGLPLGIALAARGRTVTLYDIDAARVAVVNRGELPFVEDGAAGPLAEAVRDGRLRACTDPASVAAAETLVVIVGTPVDEHLNPDLGAVPQALERCVDHLRTTPRLSGEDLQCNACGVTRGRSSGQQAVKKR